MSHKAVKKPDLKCRTHGEPIRGCCVFAGKCANRLLCRLCRKEHAESHFQDYEDIDDIINGKLIQDINKILNQMDEVNLRVRNSNQNFLDQLEMIFTELENLLIQALRRVKDKILKKTIDKMSGNSQFQKELLQSKSELDTSLKNLLASGIERPNHLEEFVSMFSKVRNYFCSDNKAILIKANAPMNKYKVNYDAIDTFKKNIEAHLTKNLANLVTSDFADESLTKDLDDFNPLKLVNTASINTGHTGIWWGALLFIPKYNYIVSAGNEGKIKVWDYYSQKLIHSFQAHNGWIAKLYYIEDSNYLLSGGKDGKIKVWDLSENLNLRCMFKEHTKEIYSMDYITEYRLVVSGGNDGTVKIWDPENGEMVQSIEANGENFRAICYMQNTGKLATGLKSGEIFIFKIGKISSSLLYSIKFNEMSGILCLKYIPSEDLLVSGEIDGKISFWSVGDTEANCIKAYQANGAIYNIQIFYQKDCLFYTNDDNKWKVLKLSNGEIICEYAGNSNPQKGGTALCGMGVGYNVITGFTDEIKIWNYSSY